MYISYRVSTTKTNFLKAQPTGTKIFFLSPTLVSLLRVVCTCTSKLHAFIFIIECNKLVSCSKNSPFLPLRLSKFLSPPPPPPPPLYI